MSRPVVLYTDPPWATGADDSAFGIERAVYGDALAIRVGPRRDGRYVLDGDELASRCRDVDAIVVYRCPVRPELLDAAGGRLKVVGRQGVGIDNLNAPLLARRGICSFNVPDYCVDEVATHTLALPRDPETEVGALISEEAARQAERRCAGAVAGGAELVVGGNRRGALVIPTVLDRVAPSAELVRRETFAPVGPVVRVDSLEEAVRVCNGTGTRGS